MAKARAVSDLLDAIPLLAPRLAEHRLRQAWSLVVGPEVARRARPGSLVNGCLSVVVDNSPWLHELTLRQAELTARINGHAGAVRSLRFVLGALDGGAAAAPRQRERRAAPLTATDLREIDEAATAIRDEDLAAAARRLMTRARQFPSVRGTAP
jgi:hypothetical protein